MDTHTHPSPTQRLASKIGKPHCPMCGEERFTLIGPFALSSLAGSVLDRNKPMTVDGLGCTACGAITFVAHDAAR